MVGKSSKKAKKRGKMANQALHAALERSQNIGITINDGSNSSNFKRIGQDGRKCKVNDKQDKGKGKIVTTHKKGKKKADLPIEEITTHVDTLEGKSSSSSDSSDFEEDGEVNPSSPIKESREKDKRKGKTSLSQKEKKGVRGPTRMGMIVGDAPHLPLTFNERGQDIGINSGKFASYIGVIVREHVPVTFEYWHKVDPKIKEDLGGEKVCCLSIPMTNYVSKDGQVLETIQMQNHEEYKRGCKEKS